MGLKKIAKKVKKTVKKAVKVAAPIASVIPGPWQVPALAYQSANAAIHGDALGAIANGLGAYGAGGGFSSGGFNSNTLTNPGGLSDWYSNAYGPEAGWAGGTPVNSGYNSPIEFGPELGYDTSIFGDAPPNLGNMSNSGVNPASPVSGGDLGSFVNQNTTVPTTGINGTDYLNPSNDTSVLSNNYNNINQSTPAVTTPSFGDAFSNPDINASSIINNGTGSTYSPPNLSNIYTAPATGAVTGANTITGTGATSTIPANGTNTLTGAASALTGAGTAANLITGAGGVLSGINDLISSGNTSDLQNTIQQRSDPFGSQRAQYQTLLSNSYTNPFGSAENQGLLNMYQQAAARKAAANGQRSNPIHENIAFSNAMLPQLNEQRKTLGNLAGAGIDPNGGNAAMMGLNSTGSDQRTNGFGQAYQGLQSLYNYFNQPSPQ